MLSLTNIAKRYGETIALNEVNLQFRPGTVHTVLGENGSGKSTLVKILSGVVRPESGQLSWDGQAVNLRSPADCLPLGLATVFQEVLIAPHRSVTDNILLGQDGLWRRRIPVAQRRDRAARALAELTPQQLDLDAPTGQLSLAMQQLVVIARAVARQPRVLILDEATAALDFGDRESVFQYIERSRQQGMLIILVSHRMDEVLRLSQHISVLRSGRWVATLERQNTCAKDLLSLMAHGRPSSWEKADA